MSCTFRIKFNSLRIIVIYSPPTPDLSTFFDELSDLMNAFIPNNEYKLMNLWVILSITLILIFNHIPYLHS